MTKSKSIVLLRADGDSKIGLGHVYRCLAIAERLNEHFDFIFCIQNPSDSIKKIISNYAEMYAIDDAKNEISQLAEIIREKQVKITVLDGYHFDTAYQCKLKMLNVKLISIDDYQPFHYVADVVINHAEGLTEKQLSVEPYTKIFLGFDYALLRKEYIELENKDRHIDSLNGVFICFGGVDIDNISLKILRACVSLNYFKNIDLVVGAGYKHENEMRDYCSDKSFISIHKNLDVIRMVELMRLNELAIVPASTISIEAFKSKMYLFTGTTADNQKNILNGLKRYPNVHVAGDFNILNEIQITQELRKMIETFKPFYLPATATNADQSLKSIFHSLL
jgi:UDP-2,4-diacetamido-2,4,6-trideoxy-beta-L-altropyranose hydrolase